MATGDKRINFYLKKFLSVDQVDANWFQYLLARIADIFIKLFPNSGIWSPWPIPLIGGTINDTFTVASGSDTVMQDNAANLLELVSAVGVDIPFENANAINYYIGAKFISIPDEPETNPRYNTPQWKLHRDAVGELDDPDSVSDQGGGVFRFIVNSVTESGVDHSGRTCRIYLKTPFDLGNNYEEATIIYSGGNNYVDISTGGDLGVITTDETLYSAVVEGYTWKRNTDLSGVPAYVFLGIVTGNGPAAIPTAFNITGQYKLDSSILSLAALIAAFQLEHYYSPGSGDHSDITADSLAGKTDAALVVESDDNIFVDIDHDDDESDRKFSITRDNAARELFRVSEDEDKMTIRDGGYLDDPGISFRVFPIVDNTMPDMELKSGVGGGFPLYLRYTTRDFALTWINPTGGNHIEFATFDFNTYTMGTPVVVFALDTPNVGDRWHHATMIQLKSGEIILGATRENSGFKEIWIRRSSDNGVTWSSPYTQVSNGDSIERHPDLVQLDNGNVLCSYDRDPATADSWQVDAKRSTDKGVTWGTEFTIYNSSAGIAVVDAEPSLLQIPGGDVLCAFVTDETAAGQFDAKLVRSTDGGISWSTTPIIINAVPSTNQELWPRLFYFPTGDILCVYAFTRAIDNIVEIITEINYNNGEHWLNEFGSVKTFWDSGSTNAIAAQPEYFSDDIFALYIANAIPGTISGRKLPIAIMLGARR